VSINAVTGQVSYLRVHRVGSKYGPPQDQLDAEVIVKIADRPGAYGFQLRADGNQPVGEAMLALLSDAYNMSTVVRLEYEELPGRTNLPILRVIRER
jgi:hypothetical protein